MKLFLLLLTLYQLLPLLSYKQLGSGLGFRCFFFFSSISIFDHIPAQIVMRAWLRSNLGKVWTDSKQIAAPALIQEDGAEGHSAAEPEPVGEDVRCVLAGVDIWWAAGAVGLSPCSKQRKLFFIRLPLFEKEKSELSSAGAAGQSLACLRSQSHRRGNSGGPRNLLPHRNVINAIVHIVCKCTSGKYKHSHPGTFFLSVLPTSGGNTAGISPKLLKFRIINQTVFFQVLCNKWLKYLSIALKLCGKQLHPTGKAYFKHDFFFGFFFSLQ